MYFSGSIKCIKPISRVLSSSIIYLCNLPVATCYPCGCQLERAALYWLLIWSYNTRGFPCPKYHYLGGGLLPHHFTLTMPGMAVYFLWHYLSIFRRQNTAFPFKKHVALCCPDFPPYLRTAIEQPNTPQNYSISGVFAIKILVQLKNSRNYDEPKHQITKQQLGCFL